MRNQPKQTDANIRGLDENLNMYTNELKAHFPSKEAILHEALTLSDKNKARRKHVLKTTALGSVLTLLLVITWMVDPVLQSQHLTTSVGEQVSLHMRDGSTVTLNTNSVIHAESRLFSRRVVLKQGEALFTVSHGWRSFTVQANNTKIRDIGTAFNVRNTHDGAIVTVLEGVVEVSLVNQPNMLPQLLTANQTLQTSANVMSAPVGVDASTTVIWQQGRLIFDGTTLREAIAEIQRYRLSPIILQDSTAAAMRISGAYDITGIESLINTLPMSVAVKVNRKADGTVMIKSANHSY